jgi:hypothetical protein
MIITFANQEELDAMVRAINDKDVNAISAMVINALKWVDEDGGLLRVSLM